MSHVAGPEASTQVEREAAPAVGLHADLLDAPLLPLVLRQGSFLALAMGSHAAVNLVDLWLIGLLGSHAVAGVHVATTVNFVPMIIGNGVCVASMAMMARALGAGMVEEARRLSERAFTFMLLLGLALGVLLAALTAPCVDLQGATGEARAIGIHYLLVANLGTVSMFALLQLTASMRSAGETFMPLVLLVGANAINLLLDVVLLFGCDAIGLPALGAPGAAYAAVIARTLAAVVGLWWLRRSAHALQIARLRLAGPRGEVRTLLLLGLPQSLQMVVRAAVVIALTSVAAGLAGEVALTTLGVTTRLDTVVLFSAAGYASAATTLVGFAVGAGRSDRARRVATLGAMCAFVLGLLLAVLLWVFAEPAFELLVNDASPAVLAMGASYLGIAIAGHAFGCYALGATGAVNGAGRTLPPLVLDAVVYCVVLPPAVWFAAMRSEQVNSLAPLWWSLTAVNVVLAVVHWAYLRWGRWLR